MADRYGDGSRVRRWAWGSFIACAILGATALVFAGVPLHPFSTGETLTADNLNGNFNAINDRLTMIETLIPSGTVIAFAGNPSNIPDAGTLPVPTGWLLCDGSAVSRTTYANLFRVVSITFGGGDGVNTFNLPDLRGRTVVGLGQGSGLTARSLGQRVGEETHTLTVAEMPAHQHVQGNQKAFTSSTFGAAGGTSYRIGNFGIDSDAFPQPSTEATGGGTAHNVMQPSLVLNYLIKN